MKVFLLIMLGAMGLLLGGCRASAPDLTLTAPIQLDSRETTLLSDIRQANHGAGLAPVAEAYGLRLYFDHDTGGIAVRELESDALFRTSPEEAAYDPRASGHIRENLMSPFLIRYFAYSTQTDMHMNSFRESVMLEQVNYRILGDENGTPVGVRVYMVIGREEQRTLLPRQMLVDYMEENIISQIESDRNRRQMRAFYIHYTLDGLSESEQQDLLRRYPAVAIGDLFVLMYDAGDRDIRMLEGFVSEIDYCFDRLEAHYDYIGFDYMANAFPSFGLEVDFVLQPDSSLTVDLDVGAITYDTDHFLLTGISFLPYFGAGRTGEDGYLFIPDGSGTLIYFNNCGTKTPALTTSRIYGADYAINQTHRGSFRHDWRMPVFGIRTNDAALFGIVERGDAITDLTAELGNIIHSYNTAFMSFIVSSRDLFAPAAAFYMDAWIMYETPSFSGPITMRYFFLTGEDAGYMGMARTYQRYLVERGALTPIVPADDGNIPLFLDTIAAVRVPQRVMGVPMVSPVAITTTDNALDMIEMLYDGGVRNIHLRYHAWYGNTYWNSAAVRMNTNRHFGGNSGLRELSENAANFGAIIVPDIDFVFAVTSRGAGGFRYNRDSARTLYQWIATRADLCPVTLMFNNYRVVVSPARQEQFFTSFMNDFDNRLGFDAVSLGSMGEGLSSDFRNNATVNRQDSLGVAVSILADAAQRYDTVIIDSGNAYALPFATAVLNMANTDSAFNISDASVPFMQAVLHGFVLYSGAPMNLSVDWRQSMLRALEFGEMPFFALNYDDGTTLKMANIYDEIFSMYFYHWKDNVIEVYDTLNAVLGPLQGVPMVNHRRIGQDAAITTFANGTSIVVNYASEVLEIGGVIVEAEGFLVLDFEPAIE